jgi:hypothetical protein
MALKFPNHLPQINSTRRAEATPPPAVHSPREALPAAQPAFEAAKPTEASQLSAPDGRHGGLSLSGGLFSGSQVELEEVRELAVGFGLERTK